MRKWIYGWVFSSDRLKKNMVLIKLKNKFSDEKIKHEGEKNSQNLFFSKNIVFFHEM